jgi:hypothetical protein
VIHFARDITAGHDDRLPVFTMKRFRDHASRVGLHTVNQVNLIALLLEKRGNAEQSRRLAPARPILSVIYRRIDQQSASEPVFDRRDRKG